MRKLRWPVSLLMGLALISFGAWYAGRTHARMPAATPTRWPTITSVALPVALASPIEPTASNIPPTNTPSPTALPTGSPLPPATQTAAFVQSCVDTTHLPAGLLTLVDREAALDRDFEPQDLEEVPLEAANLSYRPVSLRAPVHAPLLEMVTAMNEAGLSVLVISGYRSYTEQVLAHEKWQALYPDRAPEISALPGHSEHQLGTAVDFSTPYMNDLYGDFFNVRFSRTAEGEWLHQHAPEYGFTLSYPEEATSITGYAWEPWHFRYVGDLAPELTARGITLTQYLQQCLP